MYLLGLLWVLPYKMVVQEKEAMLITGLFVKIVELTNQYDVLVVTWHGCHRDDS